MLFLHINGLQLPLGAVLSSGDCQRPVRIQGTVWMFAATSHSFSAETPEFWQELPSFPQTPALFKGQPGTQLSIIFGERAKN